jgi:hypothetical protein
MHNLAIKIRKAKNMRFIILLAIVALLYILPSLGERGSAVTQKSISGKLLARHIGKMDFADSEPINGFTKALRAAHLPGGVVNDGVILKTNGVINAGPTFGEFVNAFSKAFPGYRLVEEGAVMNLLPQAGEPELLTFRVKNYDIEKATTLALTVDKLLSQSDVRKRVADLRLNTGLIAKVGAVENSKIGR